jgi:hypothetical protein
MSLYSKNPDKIKMLILLADEDLISGRAILWKLDEPADTWLMDRIYVKDESDVTLFKKYAEKNNWFYKPSQTFDCVDVMRNGQKMRVDMKVSINGNFKRFPYIDTLLYYNTNNNYLTNIESEYSEIPHIIKLREINGSDSGNIHFVYDKYNEHVIKIEDSVFCQFGDGYIHKNDAIFLEDYDEYVFPDMVRYSSMMKKFIPSSNSVYSNVYKSFLRNDDAARVFLTRDKKTYDYFLNADRNKKYFRVLNDDSGNYYISDLLVKYERGYVFKEDLDKIKKKSELLKLEEKENKDKNVEIKSSRKNIFYDDFFETPKF